MGQTNINTPPPSSDGGFGAGMIVGIILLILIVLVLVVYAGPKIFVSPTNTKSIIDFLQAIAA
jgi:hypothetical protein